jgi:pyrroloquinoline quinone biosynthesis protein E
MPVAVTIDISSSQPGLTRGVRLIYDEVRGQPVLLYPEGVLTLNGTAASVLELCDGDRALSDVLADLNVQYADVKAADVLALLDDLTARRLVTLDGSGHGTPPLPSLRSTPPCVRPPAPLGLLAELTYRCPLHCSYCANPVTMTDYAQELDTRDWLRVLDEARALGVLQAHFSGGEPLLRRDLAEIIAHARGLGMYTNLVTSGIPVSEADMGLLAAAGLDHVQLSIQDSSVGSADAIAGRPAHLRKLAAAAHVSALGLPLTINVVLHRFNVDHIMTIAELAVSLHADRLELAHTQFYGWAWRNRGALMPTAEQIESAASAAVEARRRFGDALEFVYVAADYHGRRPKPCMNGWASRQLVVAPNGTALPCLAATQLPGPPAPNVSELSLAEIWYDSELFNRFRGTEWLPEPCQSCSLKTIDFGGCRCQAFQLTGDPGRTDPACELSPDHLLLARATAQVGGAVPVPRRFR